MPGYNATHLLCNNILNIDIMALASRQWLMCWCLRFFDYFLYMTLFIQIELAYAVDSLNEGETERIEKDEGKEKVKIQNVEVKSNKNSNDR